MKATIKTVEFSSEIFMKMIKEEKKKYTIRHNERDGRKTKLAAKDTAKYRENMILAFGIENVFCKERRKKKER